jgi:DNA repair exonuclease SbcCD ATPase subunit
VENELTKIIEDLSSHERLLESELEELSARAKAITTRLTKIQSAITALRGTTQGKQKRIDEKPKGRIPTQSEIEEIIYKILREKKGVLTHELLQQVKSQLLANGKSRTGLKSLFIKAIANNKFKVDQSQQVTIA